LSAKLHDDANLRLACRLMFIDGKNFFQRERLKVKPVAGVIVGGDRLRIAVDHDGLETIFLERERGMAAAVIELDSLPDSVGTAPQEYYLFCRGRSGFV